MKSFVLPILLGLAVLSSARAHNNLFLPGDAFYSAKFGEGFFEAQKDREVLALPYHRFYGDFMKCGYAGYENFRITGVSPRRRSSMNRS